MLIDKYLVVNAREGRYGHLTSTVKLVERTPKLRGNELAIRLRIELPDALFKRPTLQAKIDVPSDAVQKTIITPEVTSDIERIIKESTGLNIAVSIVPHTDAE